MIRRLGMVAVLSIAVTACGAGKSAEPGGFWFTAPQNDQQRSEVLQRVRNLDPCALISKPALAKIGSIRSMENHDPTSCDVELGSSEAYKGTSVDWSVVVAGVKNSGKGRTETIGGVPVTFLSDADSGMPTDQLVQRTCAVTVRYPSHAAVMMHLDGPLGTDACETAKSLVPQLISEFANEPQQGTVSPRTVLTGADPCAVLPKVNATADPDDRREDKCDFDYRGDAVTVRYEYEQQKLIRGSQQADFAGNHEVYMEPASDPDGYVTYTTVLGPELGSPAPGDFLGPRRPVVTVTGKNADALAEVTRQVLTLFP